MKSKTKAKSKAKTNAKTKKKTNSKAGSKTRTAAATSRARAQKTVAATPRLRDLADWRQEKLGRMRALILEADPAIVEERKWRKPSNPAGVPVWSRDGIICTGETYRNAVKLTFMHGARLPDPKRLFNSGFGGNTRRAIDLAEGASIDEMAFKELIRAAVAFNAGKSG